jgi:hypothetical protein
MKSNWLVLLLPLVFSLCAIAETKPPATQLTVNLTDGSRLIGETSLTSLPLRSEGLGKLQVPLDKVSSVKFSEAHESVAVTLANGDSLKGALGEMALKLKTPFGEVSIPLPMVTTIEVEPVADAASLKAGLVAHYPFKGDADDHSGHENHGKVVGATFETRGLRFRGDTSSYVVVRRSESLEPAEALTISMWVKGVPGHEAGAGWGVVLRKMAHCQPGYAIRGGGVSSFNYCGENCCSGGRMTSAGFRAFDARRWQHIAVTYSRTEGTVKTYQDDKLVSEAKLAERLLHSGDLYIGGSCVAGDDGGFRGLIRDVRIYNRALPAGEVRALFRNESAGH